jgi:Putative Actinobacterial Holin-X, holin superfamily III
MDSEIPEPGAGHLVSGIIRDAQDLLNQQFRLFRTEIKQEVRQLRTGIVSVCVGVGITALGTLLLLGMLVHALATYTSIPLWGCFGIVGGTLTVVGLGFLFGGRKSVADVHLAPPPVSAQALKENVEWLKSMKPRKNAEPTT